MSLFLPFWPWVMGVSALLTLWGATKGQAVVPGLVLICYMLHRVLPFVVTTGWLEVTSCALWLCFCAAMSYHGGKVPAFFFALSAMTYPALLVFGFRIVPLGLSPVVAEIFAVLALISIAGGLGGLVPFASGYPDRPDGRVASDQGAVAPH